MGLPLEKVSGGRLVDNIDNRKVTDEGPWCNRVNSEDKYERVQYSMEGT